MGDRELGRIAALLRQAEGTDNEHEAAAFMAAAQRLATLASVDLAVARAHTDSREKRATPEQRQVRIGEAGKRGLATYVQLFLAIARANGVTCDIARNSTAVHAYGFAGDLDVCEALYSSLVVQMVAACERYLRSPEHRAERVVAFDARTRRRVERPVHPTTARINFQHAFGQEVGSRLAAARAEATREATRQARRAERAAAAAHRREGSGSDATAAGRGDRGGHGVELALRAQELEIADFYRRTTTARGSWRGSSARFASGAHDAGQRAGRRAQLGERTGIGGARQALRG